MPKPTMNNVRIHFALRGPAPRKQHGVAAIEFTCVALIFFLLFFGIVELSRAMYICNTLQEVTRRGAALAANADFSDAAAMQAVRRRAVFRTSSGPLMFADPVTDQNVKIDYLQIPATTANPGPIAGALPANPKQNRVVCTNNPNAANCIALVRVRICAANGDANACTPLPYRALVSLIPLAFSLPVSTTIARVETLGMPPGIP